MAKKRERLDVFFDIMLSIRDNTNKIGPTRLLYASNLSSQMFKEYIAELQEKKFIEEFENKNKKYFRLTDKGFEFIHRYKEMVNFIENFGL
jgi:predicted transcriptional regulator